MTVEFSVAKTAVEDEDNPIWLFDDPLGSASPDFPMLRLCLYFNELRSRVSKSGTYDKNELDTFFIWMGSAKSVARRTSNMK